MRLGRTCKAVLIGMIALLGMVCASAQQIHFTNFSSVANLKLNGGAHPKTWEKQKVLGLTDGYSGVGTFHPAPATAWFMFQQPVKTGFTTYFKFQIHSAGICCAPGDGLAFVVQNTCTPPQPGCPTTDQTYGATGGGTTAIGVGMGGIGYAGIPNSLAIEFDTFQNLWDEGRTSNHVAVQSCGTKTNGPVHDRGTYIIGMNPNVTSCRVGSAINDSTIPHLGVKCDTTSCRDGKIHEVVIEYTPPLPGAVNGVLEVWIDPTFISGTHTPTSGSKPAINTPYNIDGSQNVRTGLSLAKDKSGKNTLAYVGFTASQTNMPQSHDILAWEFTPHTATQVTQTIPNGGTPATYSFGAHDTVVTYPLGFVNPPPPNQFLMTVLATPVSQEDFQQRLLPPFNHEKCIVYEGTGGNCIVYSITCHLQSNPTEPVDCPASTNACTDGSHDPGCIVFNTSFFTTDPVFCADNAASCGPGQTNADYLKADPANSNSNQWQSIFQLFEPNVFDGRTTGTGKTPSDFVATFTPEE